MLDDVYLISENLNPVDESVLSRIPDLLGHKPVGYVKYLRQFGNGTYCDFLNVAEPTHELPQLTEEFRKLEPKYVDWLANYDSESPRFADAHCIGQTIRCT